MVSEHIGIIGHIGIINQEEAMAQLRFKAGILQQLWRITEWRSGMYQNATAEWRNVPSED